MNSVPNSVKTVESEPVIEIKKDETVIETLP